MSDMTSKAIREPDGATDRPRVVEDETHKAGRGVVAVVKAWLLDLAAGGMVGGAVSAVVAVNVVIYSGIEQGYEASLVEVFQYNPIVGVVTVAILVSGPVLGVMAARRLRRNRMAGT